MIPVRLRKWWKGLSRLGRAVIQFGLLLPLVEIAVWVLVEWLGGRQALVVFAGVGLAYICAYLLFSPNEVLAHPEFGGKVAKTHPILIRFICLMGVIVGLGIVIASAFARQLGLEALN